MFGSLIQLAISIHAAREGGDGLGCGQRAGVQISIHAAREGGDVSPPRDWSKLAISIHAAREGGDSYRLWHNGSDNDFNPRRP